ncbi:MAG: Ig-like domain-containing protein [Coriobacteriia bacterium]|nr:Ig-like domain-containing protein [Coriobacteriia bacterium]
MRVSDIIRKVTRGRIGVVAVCVLALSFVLAVPATASAGTITVTSISDKVDGDTRDFSALFVSPGGDGVTLREAILALAGEPAPRTIVLAADSTYVLESRTTTLPGGVSRGGSLDVTCSVRIVGAGSTITPRIPLADRDRIFDIDPGLTGGVVFELLDVTLTQGWAEGTVGGGAIRAAVMTNTLARDTVSLLRCTMTDNRADETSASSGGALSMGRNVDLVLDSCVLSRNNASGVGGAVFMADSGSGSLTVTGSVFTTNTADGGSVTAGQGGAVYARVGSGVSSISGSTFTGNVVTSGGALGADRGGALFIGGTVTLRGNRIVGNTADEAPEAYGMLYAPDAAHNWWATNSSPTTAAPARVIGGIVADPWMRLSVVASQTMLLRGQTTNLTAGVGSGGLVPPDSGTAVSFASGALGSVSPASRVLTSGQAAGTFTAGQIAGPEIVSVTFDGVLATCAVGVAGEPVITAAASSTFTVGATSSVGVSAKGYPVPRISLSGALPVGLSYTYRGSTGVTSSAGTIFGTPAAGSGGRYAVSVVATNGIVPDAATPTTITVVEAPAFKNSAAVTFTVGTSDSFEVSASGFPVAALESSDALPAGMTFIDDGDGTGSISGTPAAGSGGVRTVRIVAANGLSSSAVQLLRVAVLEAPSFTSGASAQFVEGERNGLNVTMLGFPVPSVSREGTLPTGVALIDRGDGSAQVTGTPVIGSGGTYSPILRATNTVGTTDQTLTIVVDGRPVASDDAATCAEDAVATITVLANDSDPNGDPLTAELLDGPAHGVVVLSVTGDATYTPAADFNGTDTFTYRAIGTGLFSTLYSAPATVTITVDPVNDAPVFTKGADITVDEDSGAYSAAWATSIGAGGAGEGAQVLSFSTDNDNAALFSSQPVIAADGRLSFTPAVDANGSADVTVTLTDDGTAGGPALSVSKAFRITVDAVNDAPVFTPGPDVTVAEDSGAYSAAWASGASAGPANEGAQSLTYSIESDNAALFDAQPAIAQDGTLSFTPAPNASGSAEVTVTLTDDANAGGPARTYAAAFVIAVSSVNDAPLASADATTTLEDTPLIVTAAGSVLNNDSDIDNDPLTATLSAGPAHGALVFDSDGTYTYTPVGDFNGTDTFVYRAGDGGLFSSPTTVTITVSPVNDSPLFTSGGDVAVDEDSGAYSAAWATGIAAGPANESGQGLSFSITSDNASLFSAQPAVSVAGGLSFTPAANANGSADVTVTLTDDGTAGGAALSVTRAFTITVNPVNDVPVAAADSYETTEDVALVIDAPGVLANDVDVDSPTLSSIVSTDPTHGSLSLGTDGAFTYTPAADFNGVDEFAYRAFDGAAYSEPMTVTIDVAPVNDAPSFTSGGDVTVLEDCGSYSASWATAISAGAANESGQVLTFSLSNDNTTMFSTQPAIGSDGTLTFTPAPNANGTATVEVTLTDDGTAGGAPLSATTTFTLVVTPVDDLTVLTATSVSTTMAAYGDAYTFRGRLDGNGAALAGQRIVLQSSGEATGFADTAAVATTAADGTFAFVVAPHDLTFYRARFAGQTNVLTESFTDAVRVMPRAGLTAPVAPVAYRGRRVIVAGTLLPSHAAGTGRVRIYAYRYVARKWRLYGSFAAPVSDGPWGSRYAASIALPYAGAWRLRAYSFADGQHADAWSGVTALNVRTQGQLAADTARRYINNGFQWGAIGPARFDASGFTRYVYGRAGVSLPRTARLQARRGIAVSRRNLKPGDLVFFYSPVSHVGIYVGNGMMIDCNNARGGVGVRRLYPRFAGARRVWR